MIKKEEFDTLLRQVYNFGKERPFSQKRSAQDFVDYNILYVTLVRETFYYVDEIYADHFDKLITEVFSYGITLHPLEKCLYVSHEYLTLCEVIDRFK